MKRVHGLVEGQTEETFVRDVLQPHLSPRGVYLTPIIAATKRVKSGGKFRGGIVSFAQFRRDMNLLLGDTSATAVTTMIDFHALPRDFPGFSTLPPRATVHERARHLERELSDHFPDRRFFPYLSLHEFEALLLTRPEEIERALGGQIAPKLAEAVAVGGSPEEVDDGEETHPAARIERLAPAYRKALHGPIIAKRIGLEAMRRVCRHFDAWISRLEALGDTA